MHILYFHQHFSTPSGSTGNRSYEMARKLLARGHTVTVVCGSYSGAVTGVTTPFIKGVREGIVDGIHVVEYELAYSNKDSFFKRTLIFLKFAIRSMRFAVKTKCDLIFATSTPLTAALPGIISKWVTKKTFIFEVRDLWPELPREMGVIKNPLILGLMSLLEWMAYKSADALIALSPGIKDGILRLGISASKVTVIPNGCDIPLFEEHNQKWQPEGVESHHFMAVYSGTHGIANGLNIVIEAAKILKDRNYDQIRFVLVGQGKLKAALVKRATELQLDNIVFLDAVEKAKVSKLLSRANIGMQVLTNVPAFYFGTSPNKFFDYIASGLPVLMNYPGWLAEKIEKNQCGKVVAPDDPVAFANCLIELDNNRPQLIEMSKSALQLAKSEFNREYLSNEFVDWLEKWGATQLHFSKAE